MTRAFESARISFAAAIISLAATGAACTADKEATFEESAGELRVIRTFVSKGTGYYPDASPLEGGFVDRKGKPLRTLQAYLEGTADYVSVAMDSIPFAYGTRLRIRELEAKHGKPITFRVVDTGGAFRNKGTTRMDICTANEKASLDPTINGKLTVDVVDEAGDEPLPSLDGGADDALR